MIRQITVNDAGDIQILCDQSLGYTVCEELVKSQIKKIENNDQHIVYVYEDDQTSNVVGFIHGQVYESLYSDKGLNLLGLAVLPQYQGQGIGKKLLEQIEVFARRNQFKFIRLNSGESRQKAHQFYEHNGYICNKLQKRFIKKL